MKIPASYSETRSYLVPENSLRASIENALKALKWDYRETKQDTYYGHRPASFWSWGEIYEIEVTNGNVTMTSTCQFPWTIISWGKNKRNVSRFFSYLESNIKITA
jgi:hypothetical protein